MRRRDRGGAKRAAAAHPEEREARERVRPPQPSTFALRSSPHEQNAMLSLIFCQSHFVLREERLRIPRLQREGS